MASGIASTASSAIMNLPKLPVGLLPGASRDKTTQATITATTNPADVSVEYMAAVAASSNPEGFVTFAARLESSVILSTDDFSTVCVGLW
jgi:hypothetical protein